MTDLQLFHMYLAEPSLTKALRAIFEAGAESERNGADQLAELDINDCLQAHAEQRNYTTRAA